MKLQLVLLLLATVLPQEDQITEKTVVGRPVSNLSLIDPDGHIAKFSPSENRVTVVVFVSNRCPMSNAFNFRLNELYNRFKNQVLFLIVNSNTNESLDEVRRHSREMGYDFTVYKDVNSDAADLLGAQATPEAFAIGQNGRVAYHGNIEDSPNPERAKQHSLQAAIDAMLDGKPVPIPETRFLGCSVRRARQR